MSGAKHTPGPWEADAEDMAQGADDIFTVSIRAANGQLVGSISAFTLLSDAENGVQYVTADSPTEAALLEAKANARLIAAAPELLEALRGMLEIYGVTAADLRGGTNTSSTEVECCEMAHAAIKKANGGAQ